MASADFCLISIARVFSHTSAFENKKQIYYLMFTSNYRASLSNANLPNEKALYPVSVRQLATLSAASFRFYFTVNTLALD
jgi:hypothetical protein